MTERLESCPEGLRRVTRALAERGHPNGVFELTPALLEVLTGAPVADVAPA